ncbi:hypothetical protein ACOSQ3_020786 [Xanthoceras sorbifolium]
MAAVGSVWCGMKLRLIAAVLIGLLLVASMSVSAESSLIQETKDQNENEEVKLNQVMKVSTLKSQSGYQHVWPDMKFSWKIVMGTIIRFFGAACGSVGGVGGGGIFVPMCWESDPIPGAAEVVNCMITGTALDTVFFNLRQRHPTLEQPIIDYDLALLIQPMLLTFGN